MRGTLARGEVSDQLFGVAALLARLESDFLASLEHPLTPTQFRLLRRVAVGQTSPSAIHARATISMAAISQSLDALVQRGLLTRARDENDGRRVRFSLTSTGRIALDAAEATLVEHGEELLAGLSSPKLRELEDTIADVRARVIGQLRPPSPGSGA